MKEKKASYKEFCEAQAAQLLEIIKEHGGLMKWRRTWKAGNKGGHLPMSKNGYYSGINLFTLLSEQVRQGYSSNKWMTFNQIKELGASVRKGQKATGVVFFTMKEVEDEKKPGVMKKIPLLRNYSVFNLNQTDMTDERQAELDEGYKEALGAFNVDAFGLTLRHGGDRAFYQPSADLIVMPPVKAFESPDAYAATFLHELTHWTGHDSRLPRQCAKDYSADLKARALEELVAEMGSLFLGVHYGIKADVVNHASYVDSWKQLLGLDDIAVAIKEATKAFGYVLKIEGQVELRGVA